MISPADVLGTVSYFVSALDETSLRHVAESSMQRNYDTGQVILIEGGPCAGLDMDRFARFFNGGRAKTAVLEEGRLGRDKYGVRGTPTIMLSDGAKLPRPIAYANIRDGKIMSVGRLPCSGESCYAATRELFEKALEHESKREVR